MFLIGFTLFASYGFAANVAIGLHELGHAVGCWLAGGRVLGLYLAPQGYTLSYAARDFSVEYATSHGHLILVAGGPLLGAAFGVVFLLAARLFQRGAIGWIATHAVGTWCVGNNGAYLFLGSLFPFGDALTLAELGVPRWGLFLAGLPLVIIFLVLFASFLQGIGLRHEDSYFRWAVTVEAGLLMYLALVVAARLLWPPNGQRLVTATDALLMALSPVAILILATAAYLFRRVGHQHHDAATVPRWPKAGAVFMLGVLFIAVELLFFSDDIQGVISTQSIQGDEGGTLAP